MMKVDWQKPEDSELLWFWDDYICPNPVKPLTQSFFPYTLAPFYRVQKDFYKGNAELRGMFVNGYFYVHYKRATSSSFTHDHAEESIDLWENQWKKEVIENLTRFSTLNLTVLSNAELGHVLLESLQMVIRHWEIDGKVDGPSLSLIKRFERLYKETYPQALDQEPYTLLEDVNHAFIDMTQRLNELIEKMNPDIINLLLEGNLDQLPEEFKMNFDQFLCEFGRKPEFMLDIASPTLEENPASIIKMLLQSNKVNKDQSLPSQRIDEQNGLFKRFLSYAKKAMKAKEDHKFLIEQRTPGEVRSICIEIGKRMVLDQVLRKPDDIGYLEISDLISYCFGLTDPTISTKVKLNKEIHEQNLSITPLPEIGGGKSQMETTTFHRDTTLSGMGASAGIVRGPARVIRNVKDIYTVQKGEILIAPWTDPNWTPILQMVSGIVTDTGGILSHAAIVARELKIPAVVNVKVGTRVIKDGQTIEINGITGSVQVI